MLIDLALPTTLETRAGDVTMRRATASDLDALMTLLSDDQISSSRGDIADEGDRGAYRTALEQIVADAANELLVVVDGSDVP
ncbi:MAG: GNAT family N-acetyltransferase, partial [Microterricola sp.]